METIYCVICAAETRVPTGTPPINQTCSKHTGVVTPAVALVIDHLGLNDLMETLERNATRAIQKTLSIQVAMFLDMATDADRKIAKLNPSFDRDEVNEMKGRAAAYRTCVRYLERVIGELMVLAPDRPRPTE